MKEQQFIAAYEQEWRQLEAFLQADTVSRKQTSSAAMAAGDFPMWYRRLCEQLSYGERAGFSAALLARLNRLAVLGHQCLYRRKRGHAGLIADFFRWQLPQTVRRFWRYFALSGALFFLPLFFAVGFGLLNPEFAEEAAGTYTEMYTPDPDKRLGESRGASSDVMMFGHYVQNNTSIGLRTIAGGAILGIGVFIVLILNGWHFGIVSAQMIHVGYAGQTFFPFVITHAAFEITAIIFSGACGLALARALYLPGRLRRSDSVRQMLQDFFPVLVAVVLMFFLAALVEAFWSAIWLPPAVKFSVGGIAWALVLAYFFLAGRGDAGA